MKNNENGFSENHYPLLLYKYLGIGKWFSKFNNKTIFIIKNKIEYLFNPITY
jgi:hypothetical protein